MNICFDLDGDTVSDIRFMGGCNGNLKAIAKLVDGWTVDATALKNVNVKLKMKADGLYAVISPKATVILLR